MTRQADPSEEAGIGAAPFAPMVIESRVVDPPLQLEFDERAFRPNPVTVRFGRAFRVKPGELVFDIGTGIGPLAIKAALEGAGHVHAVDPVPLHCELARRNAAKCGVAERVTVHQGGFFDPFDADPTLSVLRANVIIGDVSGIADPVARALGWYSSSVPTGGGDGADKIVELLGRARRYLAPGGALYFPIALDLSDADRILAAAHECYETIGNAFAKPWFEFPLSDAEVAAIHGAYAGALPPYVKIHEGRTRFWRGQILVASGPR